VAGDLSHLLFKVLMAPLASTGRDRGAGLFLAAHALALPQPYVQAGDQGRVSPDEGDPTIKAKIRQLRHERSRKRMMAAVPKATVVVMNPTHYAVALQYESGKMAAPVCVAKGVDALGLAHPRRGRRT